MSWLHRLRKWLLEGCLIVTRSGYVTEHLTPRRSDLISKLGLCGADLVDRGTRFVDGYAEDVGVIRQKEGYQRSRNVQGWSEDDANVPDGHLVHSRVLDNLYQERSHVPEKLKVDSRQLVYEDVEGLDLFRTLVQIYQNDQLK